MVTLKKRKLVTTGSFTIRLKAPAINEVFSLRRILIGRARQDKCKSIETDFQKDPTTFQQLFEERSYFDHEVSND